jgi:hypothetical protein
MKWRILNQLPSYSEWKQTQIVIACMALNNFIRESTLEYELFDKCDEDELEDELFDKCDEDEDYILSVDEPLSSQSFMPWMEEGDMNAFRDSIVVALMAMGE